MRAVKMLLTGSVATAAVLILACGGSSQVPPGSTADSGADSTTPTGDSSTSDSSLDDGGAEDAMCTFDADLNTADPADAALNDAGASVGACLGCAKTNCEAQVNACNKDCSCNGVFACLFGCLGSVGGSLLVCYETCGGSLSLSNANTAEIGLVECAAKSCATECAACSISKSLCPTTPTDSGPPADSGETDGASDATSDAPADATGE